MFRLSVALALPVLVAGPAPAAKLDCLHHAMKVVLSKPPKHPIRLRVEGLNEALRPNLQRRIETRIGGAGSILESEFKLPKEMRVTVSSDGTPWADPLAKRIHIPDQFSYRGLSKHPAQTEGIWVHEFGHLVFFENLPPGSVLAAHSNRFHSETALIEAERRRIIEIQEHLAKSGEKSWSSMTAKDLDRMLDALERREEGLYNGSDELMSATGAHQELFADLLSVLALGDPSALKPLTGSYQGAIKAYSRLNPSKEAARKFKREYLRDPLEARDFSRRHPLETWTRGARQKKSTPQS
jgi:hypothetical protein